MNVYSPLNQPKELPVDGEINVQTSPQPSSKNSNLEENFPSTKFKVWLRPKDSSDFPEFKHSDLDVWRQMPDIGIAASGGGMRAACNALGWFKGLNEHANLLKSVKYISLTSGSSWVIALIIYAAYNTSQDLNELINLSQEHLPRAPCFERLLKSVSYYLLESSDRSPVLDFIHAQIANAFNLTSLPKLNPGENFWVAAVKEFMKLGDFVDPSYQQFSDSFMKSIREGKAAPFVIINSSIEANYNTPGYIYGHYKQTEFLPFDFTPLYCGGPLQGHNPETPSGFIEPRGFDDDMFEVTSSAHGLLLGRAENEHIRLSDLSGASSSAVVTAFYQLLKLLPSAKTIESFVDTKVAPNYNCMAPSHVEGKYQAIGGNRSFSDGGYSNLILNIM
jgi:hypothetical protein